MTLYEQWLSKAYNKKGESEKKTWDAYMPLEQKIYEEILGNKTEEISGTVKELSARFHMPIEYICGFLDGINESIENAINFETLDENSFVELKINFETLYKKMVEYKAEHLYTLPQWDNFYTAEKQKELYLEQRNSRTVTKGEKIGRNDPCPCGSGKKYKKCCGLN